MADPRIPEDPVPETDEASSPYQTLERQVREVAIHHLPFIFVASRNMGGALGLDLLPVGVEVTSVGSIVELESMLSFLIYRLAVVTKRKPEVLAVVLLGLIRSFSSIKS
jgi:hypothetical protein